MIFVTVGSQKFQFNRLLKKIDDLVEDGTIQEKVFAQSGCCSYQPRHFQAEPFLNRDVFAKKMDQADIVITHGGTGAIISALKKGKKVIAVPRLARYHEHVDDHQIQLLEQFGENNLIETCMDVNNLGKAYQNCLQKTYSPYVSNTQAILDSLDEYLQTL